MPSFPPEFALAWTVGCACFLMGLIWGSFLNVVIHRLPRDQSVVHPRSRCPGCGAAIAWYHNLPLVSFALLRGRCARCGARIGWRYPLVEFLGGAATVVVWLRFGLTFVVPVAFAVTVPSQALTGRLSAANLAVAWAVAVVVSVGARFFWTAGLRRYAGASS